MGPKRRRAFRKRGECTVCGMETTAQYLYGAQKRVCRSCGVAFMRHAKLNIQPECLKNPVQCEPGQVASRHQCRKCWVQRCFEIGMSYNDYVVHKSEEPEKAIKGLEIDKKSIVSLADFADNVDTLHKVAVPCAVCIVNNTFDRRFGSQKPVCRHCGNAFIRYLRSKPSLQCMMESAFCTPGTNAARELCRKCRIDRCFAVGMSEECVFFQTGISCPVIYNAQSEIDGPQGQEHREPVPEKSGDKKTEGAIRCSLMKQIAIGMRNMREAIEDQHSNGRATVGVHEEGENFFSMEKQFMLEESMHLHIYSLLSKLNLFKKFDPANLMELAQHLAPYTVWIILAYYVHRNGGGKIEKYNYNRNFILPHVYVDNTYYGIYVQVKNSLPWAPPIDWTNIATARMEVINSEEKLIQILKEYFFPNQSTFHLLMFLLFAELMVKRSRMKGDKQAQSKFEDLKNRILKEMETWYKSKNMSLQLMFAKVHDFLEFAEAQGQKVTDLRTFLKLHMDLYKMQNHGEEHLATHF
ncbi:hypothetical protein QR680_014687 [Steinernema hermaphroditum]|uniref:Nuclear receptor domain-containing protein n=1 Tax=Steinernema hermaphroditum TaxID=289476 RepID=A0AA39IBF4_9BILA|nr:hypothetical protein QR680_014687 [Steinernema hermaphroditum]